MNSQGDESTLRDLITKMRNTKISGGCCIYEDNMYGGGGEGSGATRESALLNPYIQYIVAYKTSNWAGTYKQYIADYRNRNVRVEIPRKKHKKCEQPLIKYFDKKGKVHKTCPTTQKGIRVLKKFNPLYILSDKRRYVLRTSATGKKRVKIMEELAKKYKDMAVVGKEEQKEDYPEIEYILSPREQKKKDKKTKKDKKVDDELERLLQITRQEMADESYNNTLREQLEIIRMTIGDEKYNKLSYKG